MKSHFGRFLIMVQVAWPSMILCAIASDIDNDGLVLLQTQAVMSMAQPRAEDTELDAQDPSLLAFNETAPYDPSLTNPYWPADRECSDANQFCSYWNTWASDKKGEGFWPPNCPKTAYIQKQGWKSTEGGTKTYDTFPLRNLEKYTMNTACYGVTNPDTVKRFNEALSKFGCVLGTPHNGIIADPTKGSHVTRGIGQPDRQLYGGKWKDNGVPYSVDDCRIDAEADPQCAGSNVYYVYVNGKQAINGVTTCMCKAGVTQLHATQPGRHLTCALKSMPATEQPFQARASSEKSGVNQLTVVKTSKKLTSCSKGWAFSGVYNNLPKIIPSRRDLGVQGISENPGGTDMYFSYYDNSKTTISSHSSGGGFGWEDAANPAACAAAVEKAIKNPQHLCFGATTAVMKGSGMGMRQCMCAYGDPNPDIVSKGPYDDGKFNKLEAQPNMYWPAHQIGHWFCEPDGGDYEDGQEFLMGAFGSGVYSEEGPQPVPKPTKTPEEKEMCKAAKKNNKALKKAMKDARAQLKTSRGLFKAAKAAFLDNKNTMQAC